MGSIVLYCNSIEQFQSIAKFQSITIFIAKFSSTAKSIVILSNYPKNFAKF